MYTLSCLYIHVHTHFLLPNEESIPRGILFLTFCHRWAMLALAYTTNDDGIDRQARARKTGTSEA